MHNGKRITNLPERGAYHLFPVLFPFNMADANTLIALMELSDDLEIEMSFFEDEEEITVLSCTALYMRRNLNRIEGFFEATVPRYKRVSRSFSHD